MVASDGFEDGICRADQEYFRTFYQYSAERVNVALIAKLVEDNIEVIDEENQSLATCLAEVSEGGKRICGEPLRIFLVYNQRIGFLRPSLVPGGAGQMMQGGEPKIRQIAYSVAFLVKRNGLPDLVEMGSVANFVQEA